jgi:hypothetical protein
LGIDVFAEFHRNYEVMELLISLAYSAADLCINTDGVRDISPSPENFLFDSKKNAMTVAKATVRGNRSLNSF